MIQKSKLQTIDSINSNQQDSHPVHLNLGIHSTFKPNYKSFQQKQSQNHSLKLKDYLRLTTIAKRSTSNSARKRKDENTVNTQHQTPIKSQSILNTQKSLTILKDQLKSDLKFSMDKINDLLQKVERSTPASYLEKDEDAYDQLVFYCQLHRTIKQGVMMAIQKGNNLINEHKQKQIFKFASKAKDLIGEQIKRSTSPKKRSSLYLSCNRSNLYEKSQYR